MSLEKVFKLSVLVNLIDRMSGPTSQIGKNLDENTGKLDKFGAKMNEIKSAGLGMATVGTGLMAASTSLAKSTFDTTNALGELSSVGVENLQAVQDAATAFSGTWAGTTKAEFITAAYDIKSGISSLTDEGVAGYTELAGITAKATKATTSEMTDLFATGYGIYKNYYSELSDLEFGQIFGAGIAKSVQAFKTDGSKMAQSISTLGASATTANVPLEEQLSVLGMLQATMSGSEAGTKYKAFLKSAAKAGDALGLSFLDANNQLIGMPDMLAQIRGKYGDTIDATEKMQLQEAFGTEEAVAVIDLLYSKTGDLQGNIETLYNAMGQGTGLIEDMANKINDNDPAKYQIMTQKIQNMKESLGSLLLPVLMDFVDMISNSADRVIGFAESHQKLTGFIMRVIAILGVALTAVGGVMVIFGSIGVVIASFIKYITSLHKSFGKVISLFSKATPLILRFGSAAKIMGMAALSGAKKAALGMLSMAKQAIFTAVKAMPGLIASVWSFTAALLANPITWIVLAVIALVAAIILLWKNWDSVTAFMQKVWQWLTGKISGGIEVIKNALNGVVTFITGKLTWFKESGKKIIMTLAGGMKAAALYPVKAIKGIFTKVRQYLPFSDAKEGPLSQLTLSGTRVITTMVSGMEKVENLPAEQTTKTFERVPAAQKKEIKKIRLGAASAADDAAGNTKNDSGKKTIIQKLILNVRLEDIDDIKKLKKLLEQIEDMTNSNDDGDVDIDLIPV